MKRFLLLFLSVSLLIISAYADKKSYHYTYKAFAAEGMAVEYTVQKDTAYYIGITICATNIVLPDHPTFKVSFFNGESLELQSNDLVKPFTYGLFGLNSMSVARFYLSESDLSKFAYGVRMLEISTTPYLHQRSFKKDKVGNKIYKMYLYRKKLDKKLNK